MMERAHLAERMAEVARELQDGYDPQHTLDTATQVVLRSIDCDAVGISLARRRRRIETPASTDALVPRCDRLQNELGEGPCLDAIFEERVIHSPDLERDERWPRWGPRVVEAEGVHSMLCVRLYTEKDTVGGINIYSRTRQAYDEDDRDEAQALAAHIAVAVVAAQRIQQLSTAVDSRTLIGQALGIVMERFDMDADRAFQVLSRISSHSNRKLVDIAHEVVTTRRLPN